jgi:type VI secretion system protein VasI
VVIALISGSAFAGTEEEIGKCAKIKGDAERLICYDELAKMLGVDKPKTTIKEAKGKWRVQEGKSLIDDSINVYLTLVADDSVKSGYNTVTPILFVRCAENKTDVYLAWDLFLGTDETRMLTRFDDEKAEKNTWSISTDHKAAFFRGSDVDFSKTLMKHEKLLVQITPYGENPVMATFEIRGLSDAIKPLRAACHW